MNYNDVFNTIKTQYEQMFVWMQAMQAMLDVIYKNNNILTTNYQKMLKRLARIEDKLKIVDIEEKEGE